MLMLISYIVNMLENGLVFRKYTLKNLGVKKHYAFNYDQKK